LKKMRKELVFHRSWLLSDGASADAQDIQTEIKLIDGDLNKLYKRAEELNGRYNNSGSQVLVSMDDSTVDCEEIQLTKVEASPNVKSPRSPSAASRALSQHSSAVDAGSSPKMSDSLLAASSSHIIA
jgi:hypothetical protein